MTSQRTETLVAPDGGTSDGYLFLPDRGSGPGILLLQEIFGVSGFLRAKAADLAQRGYVVLCPDVFWRTEPRVRHEHDDAGLQAAMGSMVRWSEAVDDATKTADLLAALDHLRGLPEVTGPVAVMGYCLGGRLAYELAAAGDPDACVSYYGSGIGSRLADTAASVTCPVLFHYGQADPYIANDEVEAVRAAFADRPDVELHHHPDAGHAFENMESDLFHVPDAAARSWAVTTAWLADHLGS